jgi:hypothetical protein
MKNEQFDYLFKRLFNDSEHREDIIEKEDEKFKLKLAQNRPNLNQKFGYFKFLPPDILKAIIRFLQYDDLANLTQVNREMVGFC